MSASWLGVMVACSHRSIERHLLSDWILLNVPVCLAVLVRLRCGWDADTEKLDSVRHRQAISEGREDDFPGTWMLLFDAGGDARFNAIPFDEARTEPWKEGWIELT